MKRFAKRWQALLTIRDLLKEQDDKRRQKRKKSGSANLRLKRKQNGRDSKGSHHLNNKIKQSHTYTLSDNSYYTVHVHTITLPLPTNKFRPRN